MHWGDGGGAQCALCGSGGGEIRLQCGRTRGRARGLYTHWGIVTIDFCHGGRNLHLCPHWHWRVLRGEAEMRTRGVDGLDE